VPVLGTGVKKAPVSLNPTGGEEQGAARGALPCGPESKRGIQKIAGGRKMTRFMVLKWGGVADGNPKRLSWDLW